MEKQEFLEKLRQALNGKIESGLIMENIQYYEDYINTEVRKGKSEEEVLAALGDPRLIARTIIETKSGNHGHTAEQSRESSLYDKRMKHLYFLSKMPAWVWLVIVILVVVLILSAVFSILSAVLPVLLPILLVLFLVKLFRDWVS